MVFDDAVDQRAFDVERQNEPVRGISVYVVRGVLCLVLRFVCVAALGIEVLAESHPVVLKFNPVVFGHLLLLVRRRCRVDFLDKRLVVWRQRIAEFISRFLPHLRLFENGVVLKRPGDFPLRHETRGRFDRVFCRKRPRGNGFDLAENHHDV